MKSVSQVSIQIVFLFYATLEHSSKPKLKNICIFNGRIQILTSN